MRPFSNRSNQWIAAVTQSEHRIPTQVIYSPPARWGLLDFNHSCSSPLRLALLLCLRFLLLLLRLLLLLLLRLLLQFLLDLMSASTSTSTSALPTLGQALRQLPSSVCTAGPQPGTSQLSARRWTSTWDLPSSVCIAGPQLDLNLGPSQLSVHRWTSTAR